MDTKESGQVGINEEVTLPAKQRAVGDRNLGGETVPAWPAEESIVPTQATRPSTGKPSRFPYEEQRKGASKK